MRKLEDVEVLDVVATLIKDVEQKQEEMSDEKFTTVYFGGISRQLWAAIKKGERKPTAEIYGMIVVQFPDLSSKVFQSIIELGKDKLKKQKRVTK